MSDMGWIELYQLLHIMTGMAFIWGLTLLAGPKDLWTYVAIAIFLSITKALFDKHNRWQSLFCSLIGIAIATSAYFLVVANSHKYWCLKANGY